MNPLQKMLVEQISKLLNEDITSTSDLTQEPIKGSIKDTSNAASELRQDIRLEFRYLVRNYELCDQLCAGFAKVHDYKSLDDPLFIPTLMREYKNMAIPLQTVNEVIDKVITKIAKKYLNSTNGLMAAERDAGWNLETIDASKSQ